VLDEIVENFSLLEDWEDRYRYIIELGGMLEPYPETKRDDVHKVQGCVSQVWLTRKHSEQTEKLIFQADSDAHIVRGLLFIILEFYNDKNPKDILALDADAFLSSLGLNEHLTPQRANGVRAVIEHIRHTAINFKK